MASFRCLTCMHVLLLLVGSSSGWWFGSSSDEDSFSFELSDPKMRGLRNSPVHQAEEMRRPLGGWPYMMGPLSHTGIRVTLEDGSSWLIHKQNSFGESSETVVVDAEHMSPRWVTENSKDFRGTKTVSDFIKDGEPDYSQFRDPCFTGCNGMIYK